MARSKPLSKEFLASRGECCGNGCLNCPYYKKHIRGETKMLEDVLRIAEMTLREALNDMLNADSQNKLEEAYEQAKDSLDSLYDALKGDL